MVCILDVGVSVVGVFIVIFKGMRFKVVIFFGI